MNDVQSQDGPKDLNDENLDEQTRIGRIAQGSRRARDANAHTAEQVAQTHRQTTPEEGETYPPPPAGVSRRVSLEE